MIRITKLKSIDESEARTNNILKNPKFTSWFNGSKVVDSNGNPLVCYHGTKTNFDSFNPLSHFGTVKASNKFVMNDWQKKINNDQIIPVYLSIKNPLKIEDYGSEAKDFGFDLYAQKLITWEELLQLYPSFETTVKHITNREQSRVNLDKLKNNILAYTHHHNLRFHEKMRTDLVISIFTKKGYDGFYYTNIAEDKGSISWMIFSPDQVWPIYKNNPDNLETTNDKNN